MSMKDKLLLYAGMVAMAEQLNDKMIYDGENNDKARPFKKLPLTKKQLKARKKSKMSKKSRKKQRRK